jgi:hypothetical protein
MSEYQGYTNPETWATANWIANDSMWSGVCEKRAAACSTPEELGEVLSGIFQGGDAVDNMLFQRDFNSFAPWAFEDARFSRDRLCTTIDWTDVARRWTDFLKGGN